MSDGSWEAEGRLRRDARQGPPAVDEPVRVKHRKTDRKRWCKGKVGIEHTPRWRLETKWGAILPSKWSWMIFECTRCQKHLDYWYRGMRKSRRWLDQKVPRIPRPDVGSSAPLDRGKNG